MMTPSRFAGGLSTQVTRCLVGIGTLVLVALGATARAHLSLPLSRSRIGERLGSGGALVFGGVGVVAALLLMFLMARTLRLRRRKSDDDYEQVTEWHHSRWAQAVSIALVLVVFVVPAALLLAARHHAQPAGSPAPSVPPPVAQHLPPASAPENDASANVAIAVAVALLSCLVVGYLIWRHGHRQPVDSAVVSQADAAGDEILQAAAYQGAAAMRDIDEPRAAIIACYAAMKRSLAQAGVAARAADTPTDFLVRAAEAGIASVAAQNLTALFLEARFSVHPMSGMQRQAAVDALRDLAQVAGVL
jgi:Domain of unknown function (DUF4129)